MHKFELVISFKLWVCYYRQMRQIKLHLYFVQLPELFPFQCISHALNADFQCRF